MEPRQEFRDLPHALSEEEKLQVARDHIKTSDNLAELEAEKKAAVAEFATRIKKIKEEERRQRKAYETGLMDRQTLCQEIVDLDKGVAYWIRTDTGAVLGEQRKMEQDEIKRLRTEVAKERQATFHVLRGEKNDDIPKPPPEKGPFSPPEEPAPN